MGVEIKKDIHVGTFQKAIVRGIWVPLACFYVFFSTSSGPPTKCSSTARQRKVCARSAQGFDSSARQMPEIGEQMILANQGQNRAQASRNLIRKLGLPEPPRRAHAPPHGLFDSQHYCTLL